MARRKMADVPVLKSWEDVDMALREIANVEIRIAEIEGDMNKQINGAKEIAAIVAKPHKDRINTAAANIKVFVSEHRNEMGAKKTKVLNFGQCGFRQSTTVSLPKAKEKIADIIRKLRALGMKDCIVTTETVSKEALRKYGESKVFEAGAVFKQKDEFWYEAAAQRLDGKDGV